jgi:flagellar biosynthetic protein FlhB
VSEEKDDSQRTEEPTQKRLDDAAQKGDVVKSQEIVSFVTLTGGALALVMLASTAANSFKSHFVVFLEQPGQMVLDSAGATEVFHRSATGLFAIVAPAILVLVLAALAGHLVQGKPTLTLEKLKPDISKLSIPKGLKRMFGLDGWVNLIKGVAKVGLVGTACFLTAWPERERIAATLDMTPEATVTMALALVAKVTLAALIVLAAIAAADYAYQRHRWHSRQRMTRQELKDEIKQTEGDPQVKARIRQVREERSRKRMMAQVPTATVIVMNPTHYAVALRYESGKMGAPVCVAKGLDTLALRIREVAKEHGVPVVENPPLARALYAAVEVDSEVPPEHYKAVAQLIGYVMRLAQGRAFWAN